MVNSSKYDDTKRKKSHNQNTNRHASRRQPFINTVIVKQNITDNKNRKHYPNDRRYNGINLICS